MKNQIAKAVISLDLGASASKCIYKIDVYSIDSETKRINSKIEKIESIMIMGSEIAKAPLAAIEAQGWVEDWQYGAGGPGGMSTAYRMGSNLCI